ncbi:MAG: hypothetical protein JJV98_10990 [Desulfosarcina sp.]|nr:hypothetical protein [Desulfobacterales bacterium]
MKKLICFIAVLMLCAAPVSGAWAASFIYADSFEDTSTPTHDWEIGISKRPFPPMGGDPEYALGAPEKGSGWATGWKGTTGELIVGFDCELGLRNVDGDDLTIWHFGKKNPEVWVSIESTPTNWHLLGTLDPTLYPSPDREGGPGSVAQSFEFGGLDGVFYIKIKKPEGTGGMFSGHFIDAVGAPVPIPGSILLLGSGIIGMLLSGKKKRG